MHGIIDDVLVGLVLLASVVYAIFSLGPRTLRRRSLTGAAVALRRLPEFTGLRAITARLETAASVKAKGGCGGCGDCGSGSAAAPPPGSEIRISVSGIGKRQ